MIKDPKSLKTRTNSFHKMCPFVLILAKYNRNGILKNDLSRQAFPLYQIMYSYLFILICCFMLLNHAPTHVCKIHTCTVNMVFLPNAKFMYSFD